MAFVCLIVLVLFMTVTKGQVVGQSNNQQTTEVKLETGPAKNPGKIPKTVTPSVTLNSSSETTTRTTTSTQTTTTTTTTSPPSQPNDGQVTTTNQASTKQNEAIITNDLAALIESASAQQKAGITNGNPEFKSVSSQSSSTGLSSITNTLSSALDSIFTVNGITGSSPITAPEQLGLQNALTDPTTQPQTETSAKPVYDSPKSGNANTVKVSAGNGHNSPAVPTSGYDSTLQRDYIVELAYDNILTAPAPGTDHTHGYVSQANMLLGQLYAIINFQHAGGVNEASVQNSYRNLIKSLNGIVNQYSPNTHTNINTHQGTQYSEHASPSVSQPIVQNKVQTKTQSSPANLVQQMTDFTGQTHTINQIVEHAVPNYHTNQMVDQANPTVYQSGERFNANQMANQMVDQSSERFHVNSMVNQANQMVDLAGERFQANHMVDQAVDSYQANLNQMANHAVPEYQPNQLMIDPLPSAYNLFKPQVTTPKPREKYILFNMNAWNITDLSNTTSTTTSTGGQSVPSVSDTSLASTWYERGLRNGQNIHVDQLSGQNGHAYQPDLTYNQQQGIGRYQTPPWLSAARFSGEAETVRERRNMLSAMMMGLPVETP